MEIREWKILSIYNRGGERRILQEIKERIEESNKRNLIIAGYFNALKHTFLQLSNDRENVYSGVFEVADYKSDVRFSQFKMADTESQFS